MLKNYFKILIRSSLKNIGFTSINIFGLAIGIASCLAIILYVKEELSYDNFHPDSNRIYRVIHKRTYTDRFSQSAQVPVPFASTLQDKYPEIESIVEFAPAMKKLFKYQEKEIYETKGIYTDSNFFKFFETSVLEGLPFSRMLNDPYQLVLTEKLAIKYFGENWREKNVFSKSILMNGDQEYAVQGVIANPPDNFHLKFDYLISLSTRVLDLSDHSKNNWLSPRHFVYVKLFDESNVAVIEDKLVTFAEEHVNPLTEPLGYVYDYYLQPVENIHLYSAHLKYDFADRGNITYVNSLIVIAALILLLACANFINISTASASKRTKEVGLRKVSGANKKQIILQFLGEAIFTVIISAIIGAFLVEISIDFFNAIVGKNLNFDIVNDTVILLSMAGIIIMTGFLAGSYTAFYISSLQPSRILKNDLKSSIHIANIRKYLVVFQFSISILLIMGSMVIYRQLVFTQEKNLGLNKDQVLIFPIIGDKAKSNTVAYKNALLNIPGVRSATSCYGLPGYFVQGDEVTVKEYSEQFPVKMIMSDESFLETLEIQTISGRDFNVDSPKDRLHSFIINETAARMMGYSPEEALGRPLEWDIWIAGDSVKSGEIIGVTQDFHFRSFYEMIEPVVIHIYAPEFSHFALKMETQNLSENIKAVNKVYNDWVTRLPFQYHFLDEDFNKFYEGENNFSLLMSIFTGLAISIACLGLLGLTAYAAERRQKEIGIRKVFGASVVQILLLLNSQFLKLVGIAAIIAIPLGYYLANEWLNSYAYRINIDWQIILLTGLMGVIFAIITVSYLAIQAAFANPIDTLKTE